MSVGKEFTVTVVIKSRDGISALRVTKLSGAPYSGLMHSGDLSELTRVLSLTSEFVEMKFLEKQDERS